MNQDELDFSINPCPLQTCLRCLNSWDGRPASSCPRCYPDTKGNPDPIILEDEVVEVGKSKRELTEDFIRFHEANKHIYADLKRIAEIMYARGFKKFSISACVERLRWEHPEKSDDPDYMISNNHRSFYSRLLACDLPQYRHWFRFLKCKTDNPIFYLYLREETGILDPIALFENDDEVLTPLS